MKAAFLLLLIGVQANAADPPDLCTDRPGLATGTCTAVAGTVQIESSLVEWSRTDAGGVRTGDLLLGPSTLRFGLDGRSEIQLGIVPFHQTRSVGGGSTETHGGFGDITIAFKHRFSDAAATSSIAVMPFVKLPTARQPIGNGQWEGGLLVPMQTPLAGPLSLTLTPEADWKANGDGIGHHARLSSAVSLGLSLGPRWSTAFDAQAGRERDGGITVWDATVGPSVTFLATPTFQLDSEVDFGLTQGTPATTLKTGFSARF